MTADREVQYGAMSNIRKEARRRRGSGRIEEGFKGRAKGGKGWRKFSVGREGVPEMGSSVGKRTAGHGGFQVGNGKKIGRGGSEVSRWEVRLYEVREVGRSEAVEGFISKKTNFKGYALLNWEPVELVTEGSYVISMFDRGKDKTDKRILDKLEAVKGGLR